MGVGDTETHAAQAAGAGATAGIGPERLGFALADVEAEDLAPAALVNGVGEHQALLPYPARLVHALDLGVKPQLRSTCRRTDASDTRTIIGMAAVLDRVSPAAPQ